MSVNKDLTELLSDYPTIKALAFDASGKRLAVGGAMSVLVYAVEGKSKLRLLKQIEVNDEADLEGPDGHAVVGKVAFSSDAQTLYVDLDCHSGSFGFSAHRFFDVGSGALLSCSRRGGPRHPPSVFPRESAEDSADPPEQLEAGMVQRLWSSPDGTTEIWTDAAGSVVRRQRPDEESDEEEKIEELRPDAEAPDNDLVVCAVSPDGSLCARALNDHNEETARLEFFELAGAAKARRRRAPAASAKAPPKLDKAAQAQKDKLRRLLDAASPPAPPELLLMLAEATLAHGQPGHATAASLIDQWQKEHAGNRELAATWQARADELRQSLQESVQSGAAPKPRSAADGSEADWLYARAWANGATGHEREALEQLIELLGSSLAPQKERARRTMVALFDLIGPQEDLTREYRGRLQICL